MPVTGWTASSKAGFPDVVEMVAGIGIDPMKGSVYCAPDDTAAF
jgi:hypothetical protein